MTSNITLQSPNPTLYISNIDWSIKKNLLRKALYLLFSRHGKILDVIALRSTGLRGQAWVIFEEVSCATSALREEQGTPFFGKDLVIDYAREVSDVIAQRDGTYLPKEKRIRAKIVAPKSFATKQAAGIDVSTKEEDMGESSSDEEGPQEDTSESRAKRPRLDEADAGANARPPSNILLASNLPSECNDMMIAMLFRQYVGFKECRMPRPGIAFIEFEDEAQATLAMKNLHGFMLTAEDKLMLTYGKV